MSIKMTSCKGSGYISSSDHHEIKGKMFGKNLLLGRWNEYVSLKKAGEKEETELWRFPQ